jgi:hypothetical protein
MGKSIEAANDTSVREVKDVRCIITSKNPTWPDVS